MTMSSAQCFWFILLFQTIEHSKSCVDIVFVLDGSGSVKQEFEQMISMTNDVAKQFDIEKKGHRIAILEFSSKAILTKWLRYPFDQIKTNDEMEKVIQNLSHIRGTTDTGRALGVVLHEFLPQARPGSPFLVFVITDGYYRDSEEAQRNVARLVAKPNVQLFVATVSKLHNIMKNLKKAKPSQKLGSKNETPAKLNFRSVRFVDIRSIRTNNISTNNIATLSAISTRTTRNIPVKMKIKPECLLDVVFLMDFSGGASDKRDIYIDYVSNLIRSLNLNQTSAHVAAIYYSGPKRARTQFHLRKHSTAEEAIKDLHQTPSNGGTTHTGEAIYYAINEFDEKFGARKDARKMMIIFTDGHSQDDTTGASQAAHSRGIELKAVYVEDENVPPDTKQIIAITGDPSDTCSSKDFKKLQSLFDEYSRRCIL
ncbi:unnamed protein product [Cercopithifilaria johnstoni]|uniref:VWFA domain-containing protein n=1 Tax=Cercopithifilaria johnstoni TaxID=2874296 RepID=A0A8J2LZW4_9BILA|nr:unnamed protein product [Cercopithifilaria johnstoni]